MHYMTGHTQEQHAVPLHGAEPEWTLREAALLLLFIGIVVAFRVFNLSSYDVLSSDGTSYGPIGRAFFKTGDFRIFGFISGPGYSFFVGVVNLFVPDMEMSLRLVSVLFSSLTVAVVYCMGRAFFDRQSALAAALLCAALPFLHGMSGIDITEPTFTFFLLAGSFVFWKAYTGINSRQAAAAGLLLAVAYLTRSEGFITWFALSVFALIDLGVRFRQEGRQLIFRVMVPFWIAFMLLFAPYLVYLRSMTGEWHLSGKAAGNAQVIKAYLGLNPAGIDQKFRFSKSGDGGFDVAKGEGLGQLLRENPGVFFFNVRKNISEFFGAFNGAMPWYLLLAVIAAFVFSFRQRRGLTAQACIISICAPLIIYILFFVQQRGFYPYVSALCVMAGFGACLPGRLLDRGRMNRRLHELLPLLLLVVPLTAYYVYQDFPRKKPPYHFNQDQGRRDDKHVGQRLKTILPPDAVIMTRSGRVAFYAERPMVIPPQESYAEIMAYAAKNKVTHLIATLQLMDMRPQLRHLFAPIDNPGAPFTPPAGLQLVYAGQEPGGAPYLVYRISPDLVRITP